MSTPHSGPPFRHGSPPALLPVPNTTVNRRHDGSHGDRDSLDAGRETQLLGESMKLSIVMPAYNEERTITSAVAAVLSTEYPCPVELIVVDDGSTDRTFELVSAVVDPRVHLVRHPINMGKGAAILSGAAAATGDYLLPFDADLEYSPADVPQLLAPVLNGRCQVVFGTRLFGLNTVYQSYRYAMGNRLTTLAANLLFDAYLSDLHTCLKLVPLGLFRSLALRERGFGLDTEITASLLRRGVRPFEVPVSYHSRSHAQGKKLTWRDGVACLHVLGRVRFGKRTRPAETLAGIEGYLPQSGPLRTKNRAPAFRGQLDATG